MTTHTRSVRPFAADLEVRGGDGRTLVGIVAPFDTPTQIRDHLGTYTETIARGAFARTILGRGHKIKLLAQHDRAANPLGRATTLREDPAGLYGEFAVAKTQAGDEVIELVRSGALDGFSIGFRVVDGGQTWNNDYTERLLTEVALDEVSVVTFPAYADAAIAAVRAAESPLLDIELRARALDLLRRKTY